MATPGTQTSFLYSLAQGPLWERLQEAQVTSITFEALPCVRAHIRMAIWHQSHLRGEKASPWGLLLYADTDQESRRDGIVSDRLRPLITSERAIDARLSLDLGGERVLNFMRG